MEFIPRKIVFEIKKHLKEKEISLLLGPRQAGKTTILNYLKTELDRNGEKTLYLSLDNFEDRRLFTTQNELLKKLELVFGEAFGYVFIDEIQRLENAGLFLKGLYDMNASYKFLVTGSGSLELKANVIENMTGRKKIFRVLPLSFSEFVSHRTGFKEDKIHSFFDVEKEEGARLFNEYSIYGGYPRVVLSKEKEQKIAMLSEIYTSYIDKDVKALIGIEKDVAYRELIRYLSGTIGNIINRAEIARTIGITEKTVMQYLDVLEKTSVTSIVRPYYRNITKELTKSPKVYFFDSGLRNFAVQNFQDFAVRDDKGKLFENLVFIRLCELGLPFPIKFWRTQSGAEVDFIIEQKEGIVPIEVKSAASVASVSRGLMSFIKKYHPSRAYIYTPFFRNDIVRDGAQISCIPFHALMAPLNS